MLELVQRRRTLIVEGNHSIRRAMRAALQAVGHDVESHEWLDPRSPVLDGQLSYLICGRVAAGDTSLALMDATFRTHPEATRVLVVSQVDPDVRRRLYTGIVDGIIVRPFAPEALPDRLLRFRGDGAASAGVPTPVQDPPSLWADWVEQIQG